MEKIYIVEVICGEDVFIILIQDKKAKIATFVYDIAYSSQKRRLSKVVEAAVTFIQPNAEVEIVEFEPDFDVGNDSAPDQGWDWYSLTLPDGEVVSSKDGEREVLKKILEKDPCLLLSMAGVQ